MLQCCTLNSRGEHHEKRLQGGADDGPVAEEPNGKDGSGSSVLRLINYEYRPEHWEEAEENDDWALFQGLGGKRQLVSAGSASRSAREGENLLGYSTPF